MGSTGLSVSLAESFVVFDHHLPDKKQLDET